MNVFALSGLINAISALSFGIFIISKSYRDRINQLFFLMTLTIAVWGLGYWQWLSSESYSEALFWIRIFSIGSIFIPIFYFQWVLLLLGLGKEKRLLTYFLYFAAFLSLLFSFSDFFIETARPKLFFLFWPDPGLIYNLYLAFIYAGSVLYSFILLSKAYKRADELKKGQIFYVFLGGFFGFIGGATNFFLWYDILIPPYGNFFVGLFPLFLGYAIIKHGLFNVRVIATELLVFAIWFFLLVRTVLAETFRERLIDGGLFVMVVFFGIFLIRSVLQEVRSREEIARLAESLKKANEELKKLDQLKSEFLSLASHQLRTPLSIVKGYVSLIQEGSFGEIKPEVRDILRKISLSNERLINLVNDFLNLSRIESGRMKYDFEPAHAEDLILNVMDEFKEIAKERGIDLIFEKPDKALPAVKIDLEKFRQVVTNLIDNAFKYTKKGYIKASFRTEAGPRGKENVLIQFQDSGIGMTPGELGEIFKRFSRGEGGTKVNTEGTGLGLYLAKRIVSDHGGELWAESEGRDKGSRFTIRLPASAKEDLDIGKLKEIIDKV